MFTVLDNLKRAKLLISDPANWIKRHYEQDEDGKVNTDKPVCKFCTIGAYQRASLTHFGSAMTDYSWYIKSEEQRSEHEFLLSRTSKYLRMAMKELDVDNYYAGIAEYNDNPATTHVDILNLYDKAIEICEKEGQ